MNKIFLAGHNGMVGSSIIRGINQPILTREKRELNLLDQSAVEKFFSEEKPDQVIIAAARVGGIKANNEYRADFIYENLQIQNNLIHSSYKHNVKKLLFLGSSCVYPKLSTQPIREESLLSSALEYTNEPYAIAKIAGIKMCESYYKQYGCNFISVMPTNLYGPNDNFNLNNAHVLPALLRKFHEAKINNLPEVEVWGTGKAKREFMHVDDMAEACLYVLRNVEAGDIYGQGISQINIGTGEDLTILELAEKISAVTEYKGSIKFLTDKPDGTPRKLLDVSRLKDKGWASKIKLDQGLTDTYNWYKENYINSIS